MNNRTYFVVCIIIALLVPVVVGCIYIKNVNLLVLDSVYLEKIKDNRELLVFGSTEISKDEIKSTEVSMPGEIYMEEFSIHYSSLKNRVEKYNILLKDIVISPNILLEDLEWKLYKGKDVVSEGTFDLLRDGEMVLIENCEIELDSIDNYKFIYYFNDNNTYKRGNIKARIVIE